MSITLPRPFVPRWRVHPFSGLLVLRSPFMWKYQHVFDASGCVPEAFDRLGLEHLHERAERTSIRLLQCVEVPGLLQCRDHRCRLRSPGEEVAHQRPCRASVPVFERVDLHETVAQSAGRSSIGLQFIGSSAERWQSSFAARRLRSGDRRRIQSLAPFLLIRRPRVISRRLGLPGALLLANHALRRSESPDNGVPARVRSRRFAHPAAGASRTTHRRARVSGHYGPWLRGRAQCDGGSWWCGPRSDRRGALANSDFHIRGVSSIACLAGCTLIRWSTSTR